MTTNHNASMDSFTKEEALSLVKDILPNSTAGEILREWMELSPNRAIIASTKMESPTEDTSANVRFSPSTSIEYVGRFPLQETKVSAAASSSGAQYRETAVFHAENSESLQSYDERTTSAEASSTCQLIGQVTNAIKPPQSASSTGQEIEPVMNSVKSPQSNYKKSTPQTRRDMVLTFRQIKPLRVPNTDTDDGADRLSIVYGKVKTIDELLRHKPATRTITKTPLADDGRADRLSLEANELLKYRQVPATADITKPPDADDEIAYLRRFPLQETNDNLSAANSSSGVQYRETTDERTTSAEASSTCQSIGQVTNAIKPPQWASSTGQEIGPVMNSVKSAQSGSANEMKRTYGQSVGMQPMIVKGTVPKKAKLAESKKVDAPTQIVLQSKPSTSKAGLKPNVQSNTVPVRMIGNDKKEESAALAQIASHSATSKTGVNAPASSHPANIQTQIDPNVATTRETDILKQQQLQLSEMKENDPSCIGAATHDPALYIYIKKLERNGITVKKVIAKTKTNIRSNVKDS